MPDPTLDTSKLVSVIEWASDLIDELVHRRDLLPCKSAERAGDCLNRQRRYLVREMKVSKMCNRCQAKWHFMLGLEMLRDVHSAKTTKVVQDVDWG